jgi:SpoVK/Ycf46/Vps4 family AAA+-type ATPase
MEIIIGKTEGYSGSDLKALCKDAALGPIREVGARIADVQSRDIREINATDFYIALQRVRASVSRENLESLSSWNEQFGVSAGA